MSANDQRPRVFSLSEEDSTLSYETMSAEGRATALEYYEKEIEWFRWEYLSNRRSTRTSLGVNIVQQIAGNIVSDSLFYCLKMEP